MKEVTKADFDNVVVTPRKSPSLDVSEALQDVTGISAQELREIEDKALRPFELQKSLVAKLAAYVDFLVAKELREKGFLSDYARRYIELYNTILQNLHKELYGEKQVISGDVKVTHSAIMSEVRRFSRRDPDVVDADFKGVD